MILKEHTLRQEVKADKVPVPDKELRTQADQYKISLNGIAAAFKEIGVAFDTDKLIAKEENQISKLSEEEQGNLKTVVEEFVPKANYTVQLEPMDSTAAPFIITQPEFMRRMKEMSQTGGGGMFGMGNFPEMYNLVVNTNAPLVTEILETKTKKKQERLINQSLDLARLSQGLLKGEELTNFIKRSYEMIK